MIQFLLNSPGHTKAAEGNNKLDKLMELKEGGFGGLRNPSHYF